MNVSDMTKGQETLVSLLTGVLGAPIGAWFYWQLFSGPTCGSNPLTGTPACVTTYSGNSYSWLALAGQTEAIIFGFALAGLAYLVMEGMIAAGKKSEQAPQNL